MKRFLLIAVSLFILLLPLSASISPVSQSIGTVAVEIENGSAEELVYNAMREEYTSLWLEKYAINPTSFALAYSEALSTLLPMDNFLLSTLNGNEIKVLEQKSSTLLTFIIKEGRISALHKEIVTL